MTTLANESLVLVSLRLPVVVVKYLNISLNNNTGRPRSGPKGGYKYT